ncbi:MAG: 30S ribosomal protein S26e [Candidatus Ranarchaeia archaeon]
MPKKRKSAGRSKGGKGRSRTVQCSMCGKHVPRDKAKRKESNISFVDPQLARELRKKGAYIPRQTQIKYYCINCAVHRGIVKIRSRQERRGESIY